MARDNDVQNLKITGKYYALLIGNSNYAQWAALTSPINDITEIEKILDTKYNFEKIITVKDGNRDRIFNAFEKLSEITTDNDYVLIADGYGSFNGANLTIAGNGNNIAGEAADLIADSNYATLRLTFKTTPDVTSSYIGWVFV